MQSDAKPLPHVAVFDGLRGLAILMVIATHAWGCFPPPSGIGRTFRAGGYGVQLFFAVSAATLMLASSKRQRLELLPFAVRRVARIAPLYYTGLLFYVAVHIMDDQRRTPLGILLNLFFVHGFVPMFQNNIVPGGWSIGCEMTFYALFPLVFLYATNLARALVFLAACLGLDVVLTYVDRANGWALADWNLYILPLSQLSVFAAGIVAYHLVEGRPVAQGMHRWTMHAVALLALLGIIAVGLTAVDMRHQGWAVIPVAVLVGALVYACVSAPPRLLTNPLIVRLGLISYSVYIWHFAVLFGLLRKLPIVVDHSPTRSMLLAFSFTLLLTWPLAELSRRFIELPGIALGRRVIEGLRPRSSATTTL